MNSTATPLDDTARQQALDISQSYIVQAPAGSGKTELLTQRFLSLLALVDYPEEIWAITFTRKAAAEMRRRIYKALENAHDVAPEAEHELRTFTLAKEVVRRDLELGWELQINPSRLQIFTIDSLCAKLVRQMPVMSGFGTVPNIANYPQRLYAQASRRTLENLHESSGATPAVQTLLAHLDNNAELAEHLLSSMLASRDRWLPHVADQDRPELSRRALEDALSESVRKSLSKLNNALPNELADELLAVVNFAASQIEDHTSPIRLMHSEDALPLADEQQLPQWQAIREVLMTKASPSQATLRKSFNKNTGFPAESSASTPADKELFKTMKQRAKALNLRLGEYPDFVIALSQVSDLPDTRYTQEKWQVFQALRQLLTLAVAHLKVLFQEVGEVDYTEVSHRALTALGGAQSPTDLALHLDYRLKHLLIDEFQDTSRSQFELIEGLISGWQPQDGRTLFLVGDPMQSIYRFREANVGLFLQARDSGIADVRPEFLRLQCNFRSSKSLVEWSNEIFAQAFPAADDIEQGAVTFSDASATNGDEHNAQAVALHSIDAIDGRLEAELVATLVQEHLADRADKSLAILVRARSHLREILPALREAQIRYRAVDLEDLRQQPIVRDLYALTRALLHVGDRTAWLSLLRAPWCGLTLEDLHALASTDEHLTIWELIINETKRLPLSDDGQMRLSRVKRVMSQSMAERGRRFLSRWVEGTWAALGGPACIFNRAEARNAEAFFRMLHRAEADGFHDDVDYLDDVIDQLKAADDTDADANVQVMTIHRAKGLEFDTVIVPGMSRSTSGHDARLLRYLETTGSQGEKQMLVAPISATGEQDSIHRYLARLDRSFGRHEDLRLLYVAATRARSKLHLIADLRRQDPAAKEQVAAPRTGSFLSFIWSSVAEQMSSAENFYRQDTDVTLARPSINPDIKPYYRVPSEWMLPEAPHPKPWRSRISVRDEEVVEFSWASETARHIGSVVHRVLQQVADDGIDEWSRQWTGTLDEYLRQMLQMLGVGSNELNDASRRCEAAIRNSILDERGRWILAAHEEAGNELELTSWVEGQASSVILDRTFVNDGFRWIIDYKTGSHEGGTVDAFLDTEMERYQGQLERYAQVMSRMDSRPIKLALYFPMLQGWREWEYRP